MTSNLGGQIILDSLGEKDLGTAEWESTVEAVKQVLHRHFRPEFLNRVDDVIVYTPLSKESLRTIVDLQLRRLEARVTELGVNLSVEDDVKDALVGEGFDPAFGARPLKRAIQRGIQDPLAMYLLEEEVEDGSTLRVSLVPGDALQVEFEHTHEGVEEGLLQSA
jgi:ATP-dependent Clp protease ATP-binding subunit ClpB